MQMQLKKKVLGVFFASTSSSSSDIVYIYFFVFFSSIFCTWWCITKTVATFQVAVQFLFSRFLYILAVITFQGNVHSSAIQMVQLFYNIKRFILQINKKQPQQLRKRNDGKKTTVHCVVHCTRERFGWLRWSSGLDCNVSVLKCQSHLNIFSNLYIDFSERERVVCRIDFRFVVYSFVHL